ncbi:N/A [soil metagenome]
MEALADWDPSSTVTRALREQVAAALRKPDATVLLTGPTGSGKERIARLIHDASRPPRSPMETYVAGVHPVDLAASTLFGHVRGAFTGAHAPAQGHCDLAGKGTLHLDEIGDAPAALQIHLLRLIQERTFRPVGADKDCVLHARPIAASHVDLDRRVAQGTFREDLLYRLKGILVRVPGLDERQGDIPALVDQFASGVEFADNAIDLLTSRSWPGNVRELKQSVERIVAMIPDGTVIDADSVRRILGDALPENQATAVAAALDKIKPTLGALHQGFGRYLKERVNAAGGNLSLAARLLDTKRERLRWCLKRLTREPDPD